MKTKFRNFEEFWKYVRENFDEEDELAIEGLLNFYSNQWRGYGNRNDWNLYYEDLKRGRDVHRMACIGFELEKKWFKSRGWSRG